MQIPCTYRGKEKEREFSHSEVIIGSVKDRTGRSLIPQLIVASLDYTLARQWLLLNREDLNSTGGTKLNGVEIKSQSQEEV